jgi:hypothetical protein
MVNRYRHFRTASTFRIVTHSNYNLMNTERKWRKCSWAFRLSRSPEPDCTLWGKEKYLSSYLDSNPNPPARSVVAIPTNLINLTWRQVPEYVLKPERAKSQAFVLMVINFQDPRGALRLTASYKGLDCICVTIKWKITCYQHSYSYQPLHKPPKETAQYITRSQRPGTPDIGCL